MSVRVKICGITRMEDALTAYKAGADALGFVFYPKSPRCVSVETAREIVEELPPFAPPIGVFVDAPIEHARRTAEQVGLRAVQLHGNETPEYCAALDIPLYKGVSRARRSRLSVCGVSGSRSVSAGRLRQGRAGRNRARLSVGAGAGGMPAPARHPRRRIDARKRGKGGSDGSAARGGCEQRRGGIARRQRSCEDCGVYPYRKGGSIRINAAARPRFCWGMKRE